MSLEARFYYLIKITFSLFLHTHHFRWDAGLCTCSLAIWYSSLRHTRFSFNYHLKTTTDFSSMFNYFGSADSAREVW